jgi:hypothetical protein
MKALEYNKDSALETANIRPAPKAFEREAMPSNSDWGSWGWSLNTLEKAQEQIADQRIKRGEVIEANYFSHFKNSVQNFRNTRGLSPNATIPPADGENDRSGDADKERLLS